MSVASPATYQNHIPSQSQPWLEALRTSPQTIPVNRISWFSKLWTYPMPVYTTLGQHANLTKPPFRPIRHRVAAWRC